MRQAAQAYQERTENTQTLTYKNRDVKNQLPSETSQVKWVETAIQHYDHMLFT